jgi:hypothetical protein
MAVKKTSEDVETASGFDFSAVLADAKPIDDLSVVTRTSGRTREFNPFDTRIKGAYDSGKGFEFGPIPAAAKDEALSLARASARYLRVKLTVGETVHSDGTVTIEMKPIARTPRKASENGANAGE